MTPADLARVSLDGEIRVRALQMRLRSGSGDRLRVIISLSERVDNEFLPLRWIVR
jgi:hypothetical protein